MPLDLFGLYDFDEVEVASADDDLEDRILGGIEFVEIGIADLAA